MSTGIIVGIVVAVVVIGTVAFGMMAVLRRRRLQQRFGPEYDRLVGERDSRRKAEAELTERAPSHRRWPGAGRSLSFGRRFCGREDAAVPAPQMPSCPVSRPKDRQAVFTAQPGRPLSQR